MMASLGNRIAGVLLTLLLGLGTPFAQNGTVAADMAMTAATHHPGTDCCSGCDGDRGGTAIDACMSLCAAACPCVLPEEPVVLAPGSRQDLQTLVPIPYDWSTRIKHRPPKHLILG